MEEIEVCTRDEFLQELSKHTKGIARHFREYGPRQWDRNATEHQYCLIHYDFNGFSRFFVPGFENEIIGVIRKGARYVTVEEIVNSVNKQPIDLGEGRLLKRFELNPSATSIRPDGQFYDITITVGPTEVQTDGQSTISDAQISLSGYPGSGDSRSTAGSSLSTSLWSR